jgi:hypothetical protein
MDEVMRSCRTLATTHQQREEHRPTRRIKRSLETAEWEMADLRRQYEFVDRSLSAALKRLTG